MLNVAAKTEHKDRIEGLASPPRSPQKKLVSIRLSFPFSHLPGHRLRLLIPGWRSGTTAGSSASLANCAARCWKPSYDFDQELTWPDTPALPLSKSFSPPRGFVNT